MWGEREREREEKERSKETQYKTKCLKQIMHIQVNEITYVKEA